MTTENIKQIIAQGEGTEVEFKAATFELPRSVYESICAYPATLTIYKDV